MTILYIAISNKGMLMSYPLKKILVFLSLLSQIAIAREFYVAVNGNDRYEGTLKRPFKTIQRAADLARAGDSVYVRGGIYKGIVRFRHSGNSKKGYIVFQNYKNEKPVITRDDKNYKVETVKGEGVSYIKFKGFILYKPIYEAIIFRDGGTHIEISNNEVYEQNADVPDGIRYGHAITVTTTKNRPMSHILIKANRVHNNHTGNSLGHGNYDEALTILGNVQYFKVVDNIVYDNDFIGIDIIGHQKGNFSVFGMNKNGLVSGNILYNNGKKRRYSSALYVDGAKNLIVENNILYDNFGYGIAISQESKGSTSEHVIVRNNVVLNTYQDSIFFGATGGKVIHSVFVHNSVENVIKERLVIFAKGEYNSFRNNYFGSTNKNRRFFFDLNFLPKNWDINYNAFYTNSGFYAHIRRRSYHNFKMYKSRSGFDKDSFMIKKSIFKNKKIDPKSNLPLLNKAGALSETLCEGKGKVIKVKNADFFTDGFGVKEGDDILVGREKVRILGVDYSKNEITVDRDITYKRGEKINYTNKNIGYSAMPMN